VIQVACSNSSGPTVSETLTFGVDGGRQDFDAGADSQTCALTEPGTGGADLVGSSCAAFDPADCTSATTATFTSDVGQANFEVRNTFRPAPAPGPAPDPAEDAIPIPASPITAAACFTG
jgi:hypothetical protein